jgi:hypothetical protein
MARGEQKLEIISMIEDNRGGTAFDDDVVKVLLKLTVADLFVLQKAFRETFDLGGTRDGVILIEPS